VPGERVERRLAAIFAGDVAGYSRLMGQDEAGTLGRLKALQRELVRPAVAEHRGRIVKTAGSIDEVIPLVEQAIRGSPRDPQIGTWSGSIGLVHLLQSRTDEAIVSFLTHCWLRRRGSFRTAVARTRNLSEKPPGLSFPKIAIEPAILET